MEVSRRGHPIQPSIISRVGVVAALPLVKGQLVVAPAMTSAAGQTNHRRAGGQRLTGHAPSDHLRWHSGRYGVLVCGPEWYQTVLHSPG